MYFQGLYSLLLMRRRILSERGEKNKLLLLHPSEISKWLKLLSNHSENIMEDTKLVEI